MQKVLLCFTFVEGLSSLLYAKVFKGEYTPSEIQLQTSFGCVSWFLEWEPGILHVVCPSVTELIEARNVCADVSLTAPSQAELLEQQVLNKTRNTTLRVVLRVALPEKGVCFSEIEIRTLSSFWAAGLGSEMGGFGTLVHWRLPCIDTVQSQKPGTKWAPYQRPSLPFRKQTALEVRPSTTRI